MRISPLARLLLAVSLVVLPGRAQAQFTVFTSFDDFVAATSSRGVDTYDDLTPSDVSHASPLARTAGAFGYTVSASTLGFFPIGEGSDTWLSTDVSTDVITFWGFGPTVRAVGGSFFGTNEATAFHPDASIVVSATTAEGTATQTLSGLAFGSFLGFTATSAILTLTVEVPDQTMITWPTVNDFVLGETPAIGVVPEPSSFVLVGAGVLALALVGRRRRA